MKIAFQFERKPKIPEESVLTKLVPILMDVIKDWHNMIVAFENPEIADHKNCSNMCLHTMFGSVNDAYELLAEFARQNPTVIDLIHSVGGLELAGNHLVDWLNTSAQLASSVR
jgi:hypothetical protein